MQSNIILFFGENQVAAKQALRNWQQSFTKKHGEYNITEVSTSQDQQKIISSLLTTSLFGENRLFIIQDFFHQQSPEQSIKLINKLPQIPESNIVVFFESHSLDKRKKASKELLKVVTKKEFPLKDKYNLPQYIASLAQSHEKTIDRQLEHKLAVMFLNHQNRLPQEIKKLATYVDSDQITTDDLNQVGSIPGSTSVFALTDSLQSPLKTRIFTLNKLWQQGEDLLKLTYLLLNQIRLLIITHNLDGQISGLKSYKIHPYVQKKLKTSYHRFQLKDLEKIQTQLSQIDIDLKQGRLSYSKTNTREILNRLEQALSF